jgi:transposase-like protein
VKRKAYTDEFKIETVRMRRAGIPTEQVLAKRGICSSMLANWLKRFPDEPPGAAPVIKSTALVVATKKNGHAHEPAPADDKDAKKQELYALVAQGMKVKAAAIKVGVPITTAYGWRTTDRKKNGGQLVVHKGPAIEPTRVQPDGVAALVAAAEKAWINLKQGRREKADDIRANVPGAENFSDDFCRGQIAYNALAKVLGVK